MANSDALWQLRQLPIHRLVDNLRQLLLALISVGVVQDGREVKHTLLRDHALDKLPRPSVIPTVRHTNQTYPLDVAPGVADLAESTGNVESIEETLNFAAEPETDFMVRHAVKLVCALLAHEDCGCFTVTGRR